MFVAIGISQTVVVTLLRSWISIRFLARLDSAVCCWTERSKLLSVLCSSALILDTTHLPAANAKTFSKFLEWMMNRKIKVSAWVFHLDLDPRLVIEFAECTGGLHVHTLSVSGMKEETAAILFTVVTTCKHITKMTFKNTEHWTGLCVARVEAMQSLQELSVIDCGTKSARLFMPGSLTGLQMLCFVGNYPASTVNCLIRASLFLVDVRLKDTLVDDDGLQMLARKAKGLETLMLHSCSAINRCCCDCLGIQLCGLKNVELLGVQTADWVCH
jgi:hypothetical protein